MDCLVGLFSSCFNEELCFRCWDVIFMEEKRKSWDILGYLSCIGIALCNQYQIKSKKEWEVLGKYYFNFSELNRLTKNTYETLLSDQNNYKKWIEKQELAEQIRSRNIKKYENQRLLVSKYIHNFNINFNFQELEKLISELLQYNYYQSKYEPAKIQKLKQKSNFSKQFENPYSQARIQSERSQKSASPQRIFNSQFTSNNQNLQSSQLKTTNQYQSPNNIKLQNNFLSIQKNNLITLSADANGDDGPSIPKVQQGVYNSASPAYSLQLRGQGQSNYQFSNIFTPQKGGKQDFQLQRQFSPVTNNFQNALSKKTINPYRTNSTESNRSPQSNRDIILNYASKISSRKSGEGLNQLSNFQTKQTTEESSNFYVDGSDKYFDGVLETMRQNSFQDRDEEYVFKKENLHIFVAKLICRDLSYSYQEEEEINENQFESQNTPNSKGIKDLLDQVRQQAGVKKLKTYTALNKLNLQSISYWIEVGGREMQGQDCEKIEKYQFYESVEHTPLLRIRAKISDMMYSVDIDLRSFNRNTMYHQIAFMQEDSLPDQIIVEFNIYIESFSLNDNFSLQPVLQQQVIQQFIAKKQKQNESSNNNMQALSGVYDVTQLRNDVCINSSFTNSPIERFQEFENYYNNQVLLQSNISHFIYSKNILTRNHRIFKLQTLTQQNMIVPNLILEQKLLNLVEPTRVSSFRNLIKDLNENDAVEIIQFFLFYVPVSYEQKLKILYKLFLLRYPQQTSDDLEAYLMDLCLKTEISFYQFRDLQQLLLEQSSQSEQVTHARILFDSGSVYDVSNYFITQIVNKLCNTYLINNLNISQPFIIERILQHIRSNNADISPKKQGNDLSPINQQRPTKKVIDYNINLNSHEQNKLNQKNQTPFDPIQPIPFDPRNNSEKRKNYFMDTESDAYTFDDNQGEKSQSQEGRFEVFYKSEGKLVKKEVEFLVDEFNKVSIITNYDSSVKLKEVFSKNQLVIRNKAICFPLTQFRNWINLKKYCYIGDFETFKSYINGIKLLEIYLMKNSQLVHPSLPIQTTLPIIIQVNYHETKQLFCDYIFVSSNAHNVLTKTVQIKYLPHLTLDDSLISIISRILKQTPKHVKKNMHVTVNSQVISQFNIPLKDLVSTQQLQEQNNIVKITVKDRKNSSRNNSKQASPQKDYANQNTQVPDPKYQFNGYSFWNICSNKQYLPCKVIQPTVIKFNDQKIYYDNSEDVIKWY